MDKDKNSKKLYIIMGIFFSVFFLLLLQRKISGDDFWWHIKAGEYIVQNKEVPMTSIYSWYGLENNFEWFAHEWLSEVIMYLPSILFGPEMSGILYLAFGAVLLGFLLYMVNYENYLKNIFFTFLWLAVGLLLLNRCFTVRPHIITFSLFAILIITCEHIKKSTDNKYLLFALVSLFWANFHGGSSNLTYIIPIMYFIANSFNFTFGRIEAKKVEKNYRYLILALVNFLTLFMNPRGFELITYPYSYSSEHAEFIGEWRAPSFTNGGMAALALIIVICVVLFITNEKINFSDIAVMGIFMLLTLKHIRFSMWLFIAGSIVIFNYIKDLNSFDLYKHIRKAIIPTIIGLTFVIIGFVGFNIVSDNVHIERTIPDEVISLIKEEDPKRLYNNYNYGSYLIYNEIPTFVDGRADIYQNKNLSDAIRYQHFRVDYDPAEFIDKYNFDMFLLTRDCFLSYYLQENNWNILYEDKDIEMILLSVPE